ncbi:MAG: AAA family ATPase [Candidatus Methanomethylophilaceae archaeon]
MKIRTITVYGLFDECDCSVSLNSGPVTFIYSTNGFGKSTVMRSVVALLRGEFDVLSRMPFERMDVNFSSDMTLIVENHNEINVLIQKNELEQPIEEAELHRLFRVSYIPPERQVVRRKDGHVVPAISVYAAEVRDRIRYAKENGKLLLPTDSQRPDLSDGEFIFLFKDLKAKLDFMKGAGLEPEMPSGLRFPPERHDLTSKRRRDYQNLAFSLNEYIRRFYRLAESIVVFEDIVNDLFIGKNIEINEKDNLTVRLNSGKELPLISLSSGEKQIMVIMYRLLFQTESSSLVILDEPENSLHVEWQQKLGNILVDLAKLRDLQFIIATHSPQIIHDKWDMARELKANNAGYTDTGRRCK